MEMEDPIPTRAAEQRITGKLLALDKRSNPTRVNPIPIANE